MSNLVQEVLYLESAQNRIDDLREQIGALQEEAVEKAKLLCERIKAGETTGDGVMDFVIARYGGLHKAVIGKYRKIASEVLAHQGQFVLVVEKDERLGHVCTGFGYRPKNTDYVLEEKIYLGVLKDPRLIFKCAEEECYFPTGNYAQCVSPIREENIRQMKGDLPVVESGWLRDIALQWNKPLQLKNPLPQYMRDGLPEDMELEIEIGDSAVFLWFEKRSRGENKEYWEAFRAMAKLLGRPLAGN